MMRNEMIRNEKKKQRKEKQLSKPIHRTHSAFVSLHKTEENF